VNPIAKVSISNIGKKPEAIIEVSQESEAIRGINTADKRAMFVRSRDLNRPRLVNGSVDSNAMLRFDNYLQLASNRFSNEKLRKSGARIV
jgi:hypothetical protein